MIYKEKYKINIIKLEKNSKLTKYFIIKQKQFLSQWLIFKIIIKNPINYLKDFN